MHPRYGCGVLEAAAWGLLGGSSLLIGAAIGVGGRIHERGLALVMGFGAGALISAISFELTSEAFDLGGADVVTLGLAAGALAFYFGDRAIDSRGGARRMRMSGEGDEEASGSALLLGAVLDGIPESAVIGTTLIAGGEIGVAVLAAVFISNLPEGIGGAASMVRSGGGRRHVLVAWGAVTLACAIASSLGYALLDGASGNWVGTLQAFAAGGVLVMLIDEMIPTALHHGKQADEKSNGRGAGTVGLAAVLGYAAAALLSATV